MANIAFRSIHSYPQGASHRFPWNQRPGVISMKEMTLNHISPEIENSQDCNFPKKFQVWHIALKKIHAKFGIIFKIIKPLFEAIEDSIMHWIKEKAADIPKTTSVKNDVVIASVAYIRSANKIRHSWNRSSSNKSSAGKSCYYQMFVFQSWCPPSKIVELIIYLEFNIIITSCLCILTPIIGSCVLFFLLYFIYNMSDVFNFSLLISCSIFLG